MYVLFFSFIYCTALCSNLCGSEWDFDEVVFKPAEGDFGSLMWKLMFYLETELSDKPLHDYPRFIAANYVLDPIKKLDKL